MIFIVEMTLFFIVVVSVFRQTLLILGLVVLMVMVFMIFPSYYVSGFMLSYSSLGLIVDELSFWIGFASVVVVFLSLVIYLMTQFLSNILDLMFVFVILACLGVFYSDNLLSLYMFYEFSLVPILYILVKCGVYPDRLSSGVVIFLYTAFFSFPLIVFVVWSVSICGSFSFGFSEPLFWTFEWVVVGFSYLSFIVNLPVYGLHYWLPMAHVEAPTYGSIILAGLLLNIGGIGLARVSFAFASVGAITIISSYFLVSLLLSSFVCCVQSDFNRLVAYSSVVHIMVAVVSLLSLKNVGLSAFVLVMLTHGMASPMLFNIVGVIYSLFQTRLLKFLRGVMLLVPILALVMAFCFVFSVPIPPSPAFLAEVQFVISFLLLDSSTFVFVFFFIFLAVVFNLLWFLSVLGPVSNVNYSFSLVLWTDLFSLVLFSLFIVLVLSCF